MSRTRWAVAGVVATVVAGGVGLVVGLALKSPAQVIAEAAAPAPTVLTDAVTNQAIQNVLVFRGTVQNTKQYSVPNGSSGGSGSGGGTSTGAGGSASGPGSSNTAGPGSSGAAGVASGAPTGGGIVSAADAANGASVTAGQMVIAVSGRPVFALTGAVPAYRDLTPGLIGDDVKQLQQSLADLGYGHGSDKAGTFGADTKAAVQQLYRKASYEPLTSGSQDAVTQAQAQVTTAQRALADVQAQPADTSASGASHQTLVDRAKQDLTVAQQAYAKVVANTGPMVPVNEVLFIPQFPATVTHLGGAVGDAVSGAYISVTVGAPGVTGRLDPTDSTQVHAGATVAIADSISGFSGTGTVVSLGSLVTPGGSGQSGPAYIPLAISCPTLPQSIVGADVQLNLNLAGAGSQAGLTVVDAAIRTSVQGQTFVTVVSSGKPNRKVPVTPGARGGGRVAVSPISDGDLRAGDAVAISG